MKNDFVEDLTSLRYEVEDHEQEPPSAVGEPQQFTHASIVCASFYHCYFLPVLVHSSCLCWIIP